MVDDDENTFDYGDRDDASNASASFAMRQRRLPMDPPPPQSAPSNEWKETKQAPSSLINKDDLEHYTKSLGSPTVRMGAGVLAGVTIGCVMLGPAGLLAGAALVGLGIGAMQIPEEERQKIQVKVQETAHKVQEKALDATEKLSNRCAATYEESGVAEHLPPCFSVLPIATGTEVGGGGKEQVSIAADDKAPPPKETLGPTKAGYKSAGGASPLTTHDGNHPRAEPTNSSTDRVRNKKVACLRNGKGTYGWIPDCVQPLSHSCAMSLMYFLMQSEFFRQVRFMVLIRPHNPRRGWMLSPAATRRRMKRLRR
jgi:hypothetical protein